jgi:hypothetical protein
MRKEKPASLPPVDPQYTISIRDKPKLDEYARGLWKHLLRLRGEAGAVEQCASSEGRKKARRGRKPKGVTQGFTIEHIKAAVPWLIGQYVQARLPPATEVVLLVRELLDPKPVSTSPAVPEAYWAAIYFEAQYPPDATGKRPSAASRYSVAKHVAECLRSDDDRKDSPPQKTIERTVSRWEVLPHYRSNVEFHRRLVAENEKLGTAVDALKANNKNPPISRD